MIGLRNIIFTMNSIGSKAKLIIVRKTVKLVPKEKGQAGSKESASDSNSSTGSTNEAWHDGWAKQFDFHCPSCAHQHSVSFNLVGTDIICENCKNQVAVPLPTVQAGIEPSCFEERVPRENKFYCMYCGQKLSALDSMVGEETKCPTCDYTITIPSRPSKYSMSLANNTSSIKSDTGTFIKFYCPDCEQKLEASIAWKGRLVECPECKRTIPIPE